MSQIGTGATGFPGKVSEFHFSNGAVLHAITNHPVIMAPKFGLKAIASVFDIKLAEVDVVVLNSGCPGKGMFEMFCQAYELDPVFEDLVSESLPLSRAHATLGEAGFSGQLVYLNNFVYHGDVRQIIRDETKNGIDPQPSSSSSSINPSSSAAASAPASSSSPAGGSKFIVKPLPLYMQMLSSVPFARAPNDKTKRDPPCVCSKDLLHGQGYGAKIMREAVRRYPDENGNTMGVCPVSCNQPDKFHACAPVIPDIGANFLLHAIWTDQGKYN